MQGYSDDSDSSTEETLKNVNATAKKFSGATGA